MCVTIHDACVKSLWPIWDVCGSSGCMCHSQCLCEVTLTIFGYLCMLRMWVIILNGCVKSLWSLWDVCEYLASMWSFSMAVWSHSDHFGMSVQPQYVCDHSQWLCEVTLTTLGCLCIFSKYVTILNGCGKSLWPFWDVCTSSASMWSFLMPVWSRSDHFGMSVHLQTVCYHSQWLPVCEVTLIILGCLCIFSEYVIILNGCGKSLWPFWNVCASSDCTWSFSMSVWGHSDHFGMSVHP
jgi:hypothetical protein